MERIESCISFIFGKAYQRIQQEAARRLAPFQVTPVQYAALKVLWEQDALSGSELGERLVIDSATLTGLIDRLCAAELIERRPDPRDRRINRLHVTRKGRALQRPLDQQMDELNAQFLEEFSREEGRRLLALTARLGGVTSVSAPDGKPARRPPARRRR